MPKADKYGTSQVMAFLQQLLTYQGFYNDKLEFIGKLLPPWLRPVKVCCSVILCVGNHVCTIKAFTASGIGIANAMCLHDYCESTQGW